MQNILSENFFVNLSLDLLEMLLHKVFCIHDILLFRGQLKKGRFQRCVNQMMMITEACFKRLTSHERVFSIGEHEINTPPPF